MLPKISIVIPGYNCAKTVQDTLSACLGQNYPKDLLEVIFVDDGSSDDTEEIVKKFPVKYFRQNQEGPAKARSRGWKEAGGDIILFTDSDCIPDKNWISLLLKNFNNDNVGAIGGSYGISNPNNILASCVHAEIMYRHKKMPRNTRALGSYNLAIPRKILEELGGFNETYSTSSAEDNDLCYRLLEKGYKLLFDPDALVYHRHPEKIFPYLRHQFRHGFWRMKLYREHPRMAGGDDYSGFWDYISPLVALLIVIATPFLFIGSIFKYFLSLIIIHTLINLFKTTAIIKVSREVKCFYPPQKSPGLKTLPYKEEGEVYPFWIRPYLKCVRLGLSPEISPRNERSIAFCFRRESWTLVWRGSTLFWLLFLRDYWRGIGMFLGIIRFFVIGCKKGYLNGA